MVGMKEFCALLLAGGIGATSVVAVQQAKPSFSNAKAKAKPKVQKQAQRSVQRTQLTECPTVAPPLTVFAALPDMPLSFVELPGSIDQGWGGGGGGGGGLFPGGGGGGSGSGGGGGILLPVPGVPDADTWVMMIAGFGFVGAALRRPHRRDRTAKPQRALHTKAR